MESTRRSFDRSSVSGPGLKKARLTEEQPNPNPRSFQQRLTAAAASPASARYSDGNDSSRGGGAYQPQPLQQQHQELVNQYKTALAELTFNSKPIITNLTIIAGESLHAAKAIASTICANILEVPSEQKLPSLYLLDSIVKNIGRDYIKYFATRLHEVFCRAYRQVDPSIRSSMKHLFGTWKGVFPPQTLQMIERELGFVSSVNGSSSGTAAVRPDSQSQRPAHGIHVNPKYLERQRLQQSSRVKGVANDVPITLPSSAEDVVRPDKSASTGRAWNIQRSHVEAFSESVLEKKSSSVYGDLEYGSDILRNPGLGVQRSSGRVSENKSWYGSDGGVSKTIPSQRSGLNIKYGLPGYSLSKSSNVDLHPPAMQTPASRSGTAMSASWKNCEEEEFMWDVQSGSSDQDVANFSKISRKDHGALDDLEKLDFESHLHKSHGLHEVGSSFDTEAFSDAPSSELKDQSIDGQHSSVPWRLQELQSADILARTTTTGKSERYSDSLIDLPISSRISHRPASPSFPARHTYQQLRISADQDFPQSRSLSQSDPGAPQFRENLLSSVEPSNKQKLHPGDLLPLSQPTQYPISQQRQSDKPSEPSAKAQKQQLQQVSRSGTPSTSDHSDKHVTESPEPSSTSSLLAAVMKSGILSSISTGSLSKQSQDVRKKPSQPNSRPLVSNGPQLTPSGPQVKESISISQLHETTSDSSNDSQQKDEMQVSPGLAPVQKSNSVEKASDPLSNLLSSLVAKGLISASKSETSSRATPEPPAPLQKQNSKATKPCSRSGSSLSTSSVSHSNALAAESLREPHAKSTALPQNIMSEKQNLIGLEFRSDVIRELHPHVISSLFDDFPHECDICHLRVRHKERLDKHLEWHACKSQADDNRSVSRRWYTDLDDWVAGRTGMPLAVESSGSMDGVEMLTEDGESLLPADEDQCICVLCGEVFEDFFSLERNKWMFKGAVRMAHPSRNHNEGSVDESAEGAMVHVKCLSGSAVDDSGHKGNVETERDA